MPQKHPKNAMTMIVMTMNNYRQFVGLGCAGERLVG